MSLFLSIYLLVSSSSLTRLCCLTSGVKPNVRKTVEHARSSWPILGPIKMYKHKSILITK